MERNHRHHESHRARRLVETTMAIALMAGVLTGCSGGAPTTTADGYDLNAHYATELARTRDKLKESGATAGLDVLADGVVTDAELSELTDLVTRCMVDHGYARESMQFDEFGAGSYYPTAGTTRDESAAAGARFNEDLQTCETRDGARDIRALVEAVRVNPDNTDVRERIVACLVERGLAGETYTTDDYERDLRDATGPFDQSKRSDPDHAQRLAACG